MIPAAASAVKLVAIRQTYAYRRQFAVLAFDLCAHEGVRCEKRIPLERHTWRWPMRCAFSIFHFPSIFHLRNLKNVEKAAISCVFEVYR
jgi:hypothetical protein